jgi:hypothetical protein
VWIVVLETTVVANFLHGPFEGDANFHGMVTIIKRYFRDNDHTCEFFLVFYERICCAMGWVDSDFGSREHQKMIRERLTHSELLTSKGKLVKLRRWRSWVDRWTDLLKHWHTLAFFLMIVGVMKNRWKHIDDSPFYKPITYGVDHAKVIDLEADASGDDGASKDPASASIDAAPTTMKTSNACFKQSRSDTSNTLDFCIRVLCDIKKHQIITFQVALSNPIWVDFGMRNTKDKTIMGQVSGLLDLANGSVFKVITEVFAELHSGSLVKNMGLICELGDEPSDVQVREDQLMADRVLQYVWRLVRDQLQATLHFIECLPDAFVLLISDVQEDRAKGLKHCASLWTQLLELDAAQTVSPFFEGLHRSMEWPRNTWVREQLVSLSEHSFTVVPPDVTDSLKGKFYGCLC